MAWNNYNQNNSNNNASNGRDYAVDWEAKGIPLIAYKSCLACQEEFLLSLKGTRNQHEFITRNKFVVSLVTFYDSVSHGFKKDLNKWAEKKETAITYEKAIITGQDYLNLKKDTQSTPNAKLFLLWETLKDWCAERGMFATFSEHDEDIFKELEEQE